jgi:serine/threonine protein kinase
MCWAPHGAEPAFATIRPVDSPPFVPGYVLEHQLGTSGSGTVWAAREESSGEVLAVKLLPMAPERRALAHREAALLTAVDHPHVVPFYGVVDIEDGLALVMALADGGNLADLLAGRGVLPPGEVVTICAPLAEALEDAHRRGLVHGRITPEDVVFTRDGRPMLAGLGFSRLTGSPSGPAAGFAAPEVEAGQWPSPASDVYSLGVLAVLALTGYLPSGPPTLPGIAPAAHGALAGAVQPDPARRPDAATFSNAMFTLADPEPVGLGPPAEFDGLPTDASEEFAEVPDEAAGHRQPRRRPRARKRDVLVGLVILIALPVVALGGYAVWNQLTGNPDASMLPGAGRVTAPADAEGEDDLCGGPQPAPTDEPPEVTDWTPVVERLLTMRADAFNQLDAALLCQIFSPVSPHLAVDYDLMQDYSDAGVQPSNLRFEVVNVELVSADGEVPVVLEITDRVPPHQLVDEDGEVVSEVAGLSEGTWRAELVVAPDASGWQFS